MRRANAIFAASIRLVFLLACTGAACGGATQRPSSFLEEAPPEGPGASAAPAAPDLVRRVYTYKTVGTLELQADVYRLSNFVVGPIIVFIHGGALLGGDRTIIPDQLQPLARAGYVVVSIDHRLAPETKLPAIVEDVRDAIVWARGEGAHVFQGDPERLAVLGISSGAYLAQLAGSHVDPPPRAIISLWGFSDILADFFTQPDPASLERTALTREDAFRDVQDHEIAKRPAGTNAARLRLYCRQQGNWPQVVSGLDPASQADAFAPLLPIRRVTPTHPPTLLAHGQEDREVPAEQSVRMSTVLAQSNVPFELLLVPGAGHGLDGVPAEETTRVYGRVRDFLERHLAESGAAAD